MREASRLLPMTPLLPAAASPVPLPRVAQSGGTSCWPFHSPQGMAKWQIHLIIRYTCKCRKITLESLRTLFLWINMSFTESEYMCMSVKKWRYNKVCWHVPIVPALRGWGRRITILSPTWWLSDLVRCCLRIKKKFKKGLGYSSMLGPWV